MQVIKSVLLGILILLAALNLGFSHLVTQLELIKPEFQSWLQNQMVHHIDISSIQGQWRVLSPSLAVSDFSLIIPDSQQAIFHAEKLHFQFSLWKSLLAQRWIFSDVFIEGADFDATLFPKHSRVTELDLKKELEFLLLERFEHLHLSDTHLTVFTPSKEKKRIEIHQLLLNNRSEEHHIQAEISVSGSNLNRVKLVGDFTSQSGVETLLGDFYLELNRVSLYSWIEPWLNSEIELNEAALTGKLWFSLAQGKLTEAFAQLSKGELRWQSANDNGNDIRLQAADIQVSRLITGKTRVLLNSVEGYSNGHAWPSTEALLLWEENHWQANIDILSIEALVPFAEILPQFRAQEAMDALSPRGKISDVRLEQRKGAPFKYSLNIEGMRVSHWSYLPSVNDLHVSLRGEGKKGQAQLGLWNDLMAYGHFFQAPLAIKQSEMSLNWQYDKDAWAIWSDATNVQTPELDVAGQFKLSLPNHGVPWLSLFLKANLSDAGEVWRYLPTMALSPALTNYLSAAMQSGEVEGAKIVWDGTLTEFPYDQHQGVFQAYVPLRKSIFRFDTQWQSLTELDIDLWFENDALSFSAPTAKLSAASASNIQGNIASFSAPNSHLSLDANIEATGDSLTQYMLATPLADSVGSALTYLGVQGDVSGKLGLKIPFNGDPVGVEGFATFNNNALLLKAPEIRLEEVNGELHFTESTFEAKYMTASVLSQPVSFDFFGAQGDYAYSVGVSMAGDWQANKFLSAFALSDIDEVKGQSAWDLNVGLSLEEAGVNYTIDLEADLSQLAVDLPAPFDALTNSKQAARLHANGNTDTVSGTFTLPKLKYQAMIDISTPISEIKESQLIIGDGDLQQLPPKVNELRVKMAELDSKPWSLLWKKYQHLRNDRGAEPSLHLPIWSRINVQLDKLHIDKQVFNAFSLAGRKKQKGLHLLIGSEQVSGEAWWNSGDMITVSLDHLFLNFPTRELNHVKQPDTQKAPLSPSAIVEQKKIFACIPSLDLSIKELWLQGYKLGKLDAIFLKNKQTLQLSKFDLSSGNATFSAKGEWVFETNGEQKTQFDFLLKGENSSDLMGRFASTGGIQNATFNTVGKLGFYGPPWALDKATLSGNINFGLSNGYISGLGGAGRLLGMFSFDSILRKIRLDFSGVFEDGLVFDSIKGNAFIENGVVMTDDIEMNALAGDMTVKGTANLNKDEVNAEVRFVPDLTSGLPVLTAFAVSPQTALYVLAVTKVISPVVDAITQVRYQVTGTIEAPMIKEMSRQQGEITLPESALEHLRLQQENPIK